MLSCFWAERGWAGADHVRGWILPACGLDFIRAQAWPNRGERLKVCEVAVHPPTLHLLEPGAQAHQGEVRQVLLHQEGWEPGTGCSDFETVEIWTWISTAQSWLTNLESNYVLLLFSFLSISASFYCSAGTILNNTLDKTFIAFKFLPDKYLMQWIPAQFLQRPKMSKKV